MPTHTWKLFLGGVFFLSGLSGCGHLALLDAQEAYRVADLDTAQAIIDPYIIEHGDGANRVIAYLEQGTIRLAAGDVAASNESFRIADEAVSLIDEGPDVSLSKEVLAMVTNLNALKYRGYSYDRIMLSTYRAINFMALGRPDAARVELRRAFNHQGQAVQRNAKRIEKAEEAAKQAKADKTKQGYDADRAKKDPTFQENLSQTYAGLDKYAAYTDYVNPFTEWLQGIYHMAQAVDGSDTERARKSIQRVMGMVPDNLYLTQDALMAQRVADGQTVPPVTYVVLATGTAPKRGQVRIDIPLFLVNDEVDYVGANFPKLVMNEFYLEALYVHTGADTIQTHLLCDMDAVVAQEFENELPVVIIKTLVSAGTKAAIAYGLKDATKNDDFANVAMRIVAGLYQAATNEADLRTWASLPKQFQYARLQTPPDRIIQIDSPGGESISVELRPGTVNVVMVRSIHPDAPLQINQFSLGEGAQVW